MTTDLTPTEELVMDVLAARFRTGSDMWGFSRRPAIKAALERLANRGLIRWRQATEDVIDAWMTPEGRAAWLSETLLTPDQRRIKELEGEVAAALTTVRLMATPGRASGGVA